MSSSGNSGCLIQLVFAAALLFAIEAIGSLEHKLKLQFIGAAIVLFWAWTSTKRDSD